MHCAAIACMIVIANSKREFERHQLLFKSANDTKFYILELQTSYCGDLRRVFIFQKHDAKGII